MRLRVTIETMSALSRARAPTVLALLVAGCANNTIRLLDDDGGGTSDGASEGSDATQSDGPGATGPSTGEDAPSPDGPGDAPDTVTVTDPDPDPSAPDPSDPDPSDPD